MKQLPWGPLLALGSALILVAVCAWWWLTELETPRAPTPGYQGAPFKMLSAAMPPIGPFESFYVNNDNPFVPWRDRVRETERMQQPTTIATKPQPKSIVKQVPAPVLKLPPKPKGGGDAPQVIGFTRQTDGAIDALFQFAGDAKPRQVKAGERIGRWTFVGVENGSVAVFTDETGRQYRMVIGSR